MIVSLVFHTNILLYYIFCANHKWIVNPVVIPEMYSKILLYDCKRIRFV